MFEMSAISSTLENLQSLLGLQIWSWVKYPTKTKCGLTIKTFGKIGAVVLVFVAEFPLQWLM